MLKNNAVYETEITDYTADGMGIAHADGCAVFIPNAIAGERVRISIVHAGKNKAIGKIEDILERSPHRIVRDCPWAKVCGGCDFRHMDYAEELRLKAQRVRDALRRLGGWDPGELPIAGAKELTGYRNKAIFPVGGRRLLPRSHPRSDPRGSLSSAERRRQRRPTGGGGLRAQRARQRLR